MTYNQKRRSLLLISHYACRYRPGSLEAVRSTNPTNRRKIFGRAAMVFGVVSLLSALISYARSNFVPWGDYGGHPLFDERFLLFVTLPTFLLTAILAVAAMTAQKTR